MPKIKTSRAAAKRFKKTGAGKLKRNKAYKSHILTKKIHKEKEKSEKSNHHRCYKFQEHEEDFTLFIRISEGGNKTWQELKAA